MCSVPARSRRIASRGRSIDELLQPQVEQRQRRPRDDQVDLGQLEQRRLARARAVADAQALDDELGIPAVPAGRQRVDLDRLAELRASVAISVSR